jgi:hypothetical protein
MKLNEMQNQTNVNHNSWTDQNWTTQLHVGIVNPQLKLSLPTCLRLQGTLRVNFAS